MIRRTVTALLVALVASFALSSPASAATKKTAGPRAKQSTTTGSTKAKPTLKKKRATRKKAAAKASTAAKHSGKKPLKRKPTTKPH